MIPPGLSLSSGQIKILITQAWLSDPRILLQLFFSKSAKLQTSIYGANMEMILKKPSFEKLPRKSWAHMSRETPAGENFSQQREAVFVSMGHQEA